MIRFISCELNRHQKGNDMKQLVKLNKRPRCGGRGEKRQIGDQELHVLML
jgi:hypothetical protein